LQCVAVCCSVLQCVAVCCSVLQSVAVCCSVLQCVAIRAKETYEYRVVTCSRLLTPLQDAKSSLPANYFGFMAIVVHCSKRQHARLIALHHTTSCRNTLQCSAIPCNTLQSAATRRNTLQHTATHCCQLQHSVSL